MKIVLLMLSLLLNVQLLSQHHFAPWAYSDIITLADDVQYVNIDGDAISDVLYTEYDESEVVAVGWEQRIAGSTGHIYSLPMPDFPIGAVGIIDLDQDNLGDVVYSHLETGDVYYCTQVCDSEWSAIARLESASGKYSVFKIHDVNGDNIDDLVGRDKNSGFRHTMELGLGEGMFGPTHSLFIGYSNIVATRYSDVSGDGITDITITTIGGSRIVYYPGLESGGWGSEVVVASISNAFGSAIGDIDGDGLPDVVAASFTGGPNTIRLYRNLGNDEFENVSLISGINATRSINCADVNGDGLSDILLCNSNGMGSWIYMNEGDLEFNEREISDDFTASGVFTDIDADGKLDIQLIESGSDATESLWWKGNGNGGFSSKGDVYSQYKVLPYRSVGDFDNDGVTDIMSLRDHYGSRSLWVQFGTGGAKFSSAELIFADFQADQFTTADIDQDGTLDLIVRDDRTVSLLRGTGNATYQSPQVLFEEIRNFIIIDIDNDGALDWILHDDDSSVYLHQKMSDGSEDMSVLVEGTNIRIYVSDIDLDGLLDVVILENVSEGKKMSIFRNTVKGLVLAAEKQIALNQNIISIGGLKYDSDGLADLVFTQGSSLKWMKRNINGTFEDEQVTSYPDAISSFEVIHLPEQDRSVIWQKTGEYGYRSANSSQFSPQQQLLSGITDPLYNRIDINNDGRPDYLGTVDGTNTVGWYQEDGVDAPNLSVIKRPCPSAADGAVKIHTDCGVENTIVWSDGYTGSYRDNMSAGTYTYIATSGSDIDTVTFEFLEEELPDYKVQVANDTGGNNGTFRITSLPQTDIKNLTWESDSGETGTRQIRLDAGQYAVAWSTINGCMVEKTINIAGTVATDDIALASNINLWPTAADSEITIENTSEDEFVVEILSLSGSSVGASVQLSTASRVSIDVSSLPPSMYVALCRSKNTSYTARFMKM